MQNDDLYPSDGTFLGGVPLEPADQIIERKKERAQTLESVSVLKDLLKRLDERIDFYNSVDSIDDDAKVNPEEFMHMYSAYKLAKDCLISERNWIADLIEANSKNL